MTVAPDIIAKCKNIKIVFTDVDGVLTDGKLYYNDNGETLKVFHALDGIGIKNLIKANINVGVITAKNTPINSKRMKELSINLLFQGVSDKLAKCKAVIASLDLSLDQVAYIGDDLPDFPLLMACGLSATVPHAITKIQDAVDYRTVREGGNGAFREFADLILANQHE